MAMMMSVHPFAGLAIVGFVGGAGFTFLAVRERQRRAAVAARADYQYRALMAAPVASLLAPSVERVTRRRAMPRLSELPTRPLRAH